jgi:hypothetical protein
VVDFMEIDSSVSFKGSVAAGSASLSDVTGLSSAAGDGCKT